MVRANHTNDPARAAWENVTVGADWYELDNQSSTDPMREALVHLLDVLDSSVDPGIAIALTVGTPIAVCVLFCLCACCRCLRQRVRETGFKRMITCGAFEPTPKRGLSPDVALESHQDELAEVDSVDEATDARSPLPSDTEEPDPSDVLPESDAEGAHAAKVAAAMETCVLNAVQRGVADDGEEADDTDDAEADDDVAEELAKPTHKRRPSNGPGPLVRSKWNEPQATGRRTPNGKAKAKVGFK